MCAAACAVACVAVCAVGCVADRAETPCRRAFACAVACAVGRAAGRAVGCVARAVGVGSGRQRTAADGSVGRGRDGGLRTVAAGCSGKAEHGGTAADDGATEERGRTRAGRRDVRRMAEVASDSERT